MTKDSSPTPPTPMFTYANFGSGSVAGGAVPLYAGRPKFRGVKKKTSTFPFLDKSELRVKNRSAVFRHRCKKLGQQVKMSFTALPTEIKWHIYKTAHVSMFQEVLDEILLGNDDETCVCCMGGYTRPLYAGLCKCLCSKCGDECRVCRHTC